MTITRFPKPASYLSDTGLCEDSAHSPQKPDEGESDSKPTERVPAPIKNSGIGDLNLSQSQSSKRTAFRAPSFHSRKKAGIKITALTAYDYSSAMLLDRAGVDVILVGDSLSSVVQGLSSTLPVSMDEMVYHCRCVSRGVEHALVIGDLPFLSYHLSPIQALENAGRLVKEAGVHAVKLEGGIAVREAIEKITLADIPVVAHIGLTPQSLLRMGGYKVQGKSRASGSYGESLPGTRERIIEDALAVEEAGASAVVLECIPVELARTITELLTIPTIGIGAGPFCDGQILVTPDMLGLTMNKTPKFVKRFAELGLQTQQAIQAYIEEVKLGSFPEQAHCYQEHGGANEHVPANAAH